MIFCLMLVNIIPLALSAAPLDCGRYTKVKHNIVPKWKKNSGTLCNQIAFHCLLSAYMGHQIYTPHFAKRIFVSARLSFVLPLPQSTWRSILLLAQHTCNFLKLLAMDPRYQYPTSRMTTPEVRVVFHMEKLWNKLTCLWQLSHFLTTPSVSNTVIGQ
jgi:hypothetical protein